MKKIINQSLENHKKAFESLDINKIELIASDILAGIKTGSKILWCGNGGSASQASHLNAELLGGMFKKKINPFQSICLNNDTSFITAWSNDDSFDNVFKRQLEAIAKENDFLILLTTSGNSVNLIRAAEYARKKKVKVISFTGNNGGALVKKSDLNINIQSKITQSIQEMHILIGHIICEIIEKG